MTRSLITSPDGFVRWVSLVSLLISLIGGLSFVGAQQAVTSATLSGRVADASGAAISGTTITATNLDKNLAWTVTSDGQGRYRFLYLPVGSYQLKAEHAGFATLERQLTLSVGQALDVALKLAVGDFTAKIDV